MPFQILPFADTGDARSEIQAGIVEQTYYRWRKEYGGLKVDQAKRLKLLVHPD